MRVVNASPLIHLARVSLLDLLRQPQGTVSVVVPDVVFGEVMRGAMRDPSARLVQEATLDWLTIVPTPPPHTLIRQGPIDAGEIAVLSLALANRGATAVLDDRLASREPTRLNIPVIGTLGILLDAKRFQIIPSVRAPLERLRTLGMRLSDAIWDEVMRQAGE
jgi:predicted nucleic acid-binding protein